MQTYVYYMAKGWHTSTVPFSDLHNAIHKQGSSALNVDFLFTRRGARLALMHYHMVEFHWKVSSLATTSASSNKSSKIEGSDQFQICTWLPRL